MAHQVCTEIGEWVEDSILQPLEECVRKKCKWWCLCCNKWFCFIVWVVVTVVNWVVHTVCEIVADVVDLVVAVVTGLVEIIIGIFTWDWARVWDGLVRIFGTLIGVVFDLFRIVTGGDLIAFVTDSVNKWRLRDYVRDLIDNNQSYTDEDRRRIKEALGVDNGGFGLRLRVEVMRGYVRSDATSTGGGVPDLVRWHNDPNPNTRVDLKILSGFDWTSFWERGRPEIVADDGSIAESDIDDYLDDPSAKGVKRFRIFCMSNGLLDTKLSTAVVKAKALGLRLRFNKQDVQLTQASQVRLSPNRTAVGSFFTAPPFNRVTGSTDPQGAQQDLCLPISVGTFLFTDNSFTGYSAHLSDATCLDGRTTFPGDDLTGSVFRDRLPDFAFRYVPIHEIGHTFGLCHVDGLDRIMYSPKEKSWIDWWTIPEYLYLHGGPVFTFDEAKKVWDYIIAHFSVTCLSTRQF